MRKFQEFKKTTNSNLYRKLYREYLDKKEGKCSICRPHKGCNTTNKWYGTTDFFTKRENQHLRFPSWKLVSKSRKQWMKKPLKIKTKELKHRNGTYAEIYW